MGHGRFLYEPWQRRNPTIDTEKRGNSLIYASVVTLNSHRIHSVVVDALAGRVRRIVFHISTVFSNYGRGIRSYRLRLYHTCRSRIS